MQLTLWHKAMLFSLIFNISAFGLIGVWSRFTAQQQPLTEIIVDLSMPATESVQQIDGHFSQDNFEAAGINPSSTDSSPHSAFNHGIKQEQDFLNISTNTNTTRTPAASLSNSVNPAVSNKSSAPPAGSMGINPPKIVNRVQPVYPELARRNGASGTVKVKALILTDGSVDDCFVIASSGNTDLDTAALNAVQAWQFSPAIDRATKQPIKSYVVLPILFSLN